MDEIAVSGGTQDGLASLVVYGVISEIRNAQSAHEAITPFILAKEGKNATLARQGNAGSEGDGDKETSTAVDESVLRRCW